jgi:phosphoribosylamine--glycine ligase
VKADGLCAGKGVVVAETMEEARTSARAMLSGASFGDAGTTIVLEERLLGSEASIHAICDGHRAVLLPPAQDHKRIFEGDEGPNTGGMGTYAPTPLVDATMLERIHREVIERVVLGMKRDGTPFVGALFGGLMVSPSGEPVVLEFNVRFGDPETQVLMPTILGDFGKALLQAAQGQLEDGVLSSSGEHALCVVLAAENYPGTPTQGDEITGLDQAENFSDVHVYHAGTRLEDGKLVTAGGRVLGVSAKGPDLQTARNRAYEAADKIQFRGKQMRRDIGYRALDGVKADR